MSKTYILESSWKLPNGLLTKYKGNETSN